MLLVHLCSSTLLHIYDTSQEHDENKGELQNAIKHARLPQLSSRLELCYPNVTYLFLIVLYAVVRYPYTSPIRFMSWAPIYSYQISHFCRQDLPQSGSVCALFKILVLQFSQIKVWQKFVQSIEINMIFPKNLDLNFSQKIWNKYFRNKP